ncbi:hypothetical protein [Sphingomonas lenta]|uniref:hypothetical protein n=1 Tax=Sphingomonas lenta TaxID=1141887 RepID=UPI00159542AC|nr:hypothetical protein [Sphingomonas lenta]
MALLAASRATPSPRSELLQRLQSLPIEEAVEETGRLAVRFEPGGSESDFVAQLKAAGFSTAEAGDFPCTTSRCAYVSWWYDEVGWHATKLSWTTDKRDRVAAVYVSELMN